MPHKLGVLPGLASSRTSNSGKMTVRIEQLFEQVIYFIFISGELSERIFEDPGSDVCSVSATVPFSRFSASGLNPKRSEGVRGRGARRAVFPVGI